MAFYDIDRILDEADSLTVAQFLGIEYRHSGRNHFIRCPGHEKRLGREDTHLTNAWLTPKGYYCAACATSVGLVEMVREIEKCDFKEALALIADSLGGRQYYETTGENVGVEREKILSEEDLKLIGLKNTISYDIPRNFASTKAEILEYALKLKDSEDEELAKLNIQPKFDDNSWNEDTSKHIWLASQHKTYSLKAFFEENPTLYYYIVKNKAKDAMDMYKAWVDNLENKKSDEYLMILPVISIVKETIKEEEFIYSLKEIFKGFYNRCNEIYLSITDEMAGEEHQEKQVIETPKMRLDLFMDTH